MNRPATLPSAGPLALAALIFIAALSRVLPHPPNFSPIEAVALFGGAYFAKRHWALLVPLAAMFLSDLVLGLANGGIYWDYFRSAGYLLVYVCIALSTALGFGLRGKVTGSRVLGYSLAGSLLGVAPRLVDSRRLARTVEVASLIPLCALLAAGMLRFVFRERRLTIDGIFATVAAFVGMFAARRRD